MRKLVDSEIYTQTFGRSNDIINAVNQQLYNDIGIIAPEQIESALMDLKIRSKKSSYYAFLSDALGLYETRGLVRLFNLTSVSGGRSRIPAAIPFIASVGRNRAKDSTGTIKDRVIYMNMYRIGNWSSDEKYYNGLNALTDLYTCLESGVISYKLLIEGKADKMLNDKNVIEYLTRIYTYMFALCMQKTKTTFGGSDFQNDAAYFLIAKFFLLYVLDKAESDTVDDYAHLIIKNHSSLEALKSFESISQINYSSLSSFLKTFGEAFYNGEPVLLINFETSWLMLFGDSTPFAIEYLPYLIHFLFAVMHGATLGGTLRLSRQYDVLNKLGLPRLYNAIVNALK